MLQKNWQLTFILGSSWLHLRCSSSFPTLCLLLSFFPSLLWWHFPNPLLWTKHKENGDRLEKSQKEQTIYVCSMRDSILVHIYSSVNGLLFSNKAYKKNLFSKKLSGVENEREKCSFAWWAVKVNCQENMTTQAADKAIWRAIGWERAEVEWWELTEGGE